MPDDARRKPPIATTDSGIPAPSDEFSLTVGPGGPTVLHDHYVVQKMQHFNRERVPERLVHAKGSGAHGFLEVTQGRTRVNQVMSETDRDHLVSNIVAHASNEVTEEIQWRVIAYWSNIDAQLDARIAAGLGRGDGASANGAQAAAQQLVASRANRA